MAVRTMLSLLMNAWWALGALIESCLLSPKKQQRGYSGLGKLNDGARLLTQWQYAAEDVMDEQYAFLRAHAERCKVPDCEHCNRLAGVKMILLMPFDEVKFVVKRKKEKGATI